MTPLVKIDSVDSLRSAIMALEIQKETEGKLLKEKFLHAYEGIKPINLVKNAFRDMAASTEIRQWILNAVLGLIAGGLSKFLLDGTSQVPLKKVINTGVITSISNFIQANGDTIKKLGKDLISIFRKKSGDDSMSLDESNETSENKEPGN